MSEMSTLNGYEIVDKKAREDILVLKNGGIPGGGGSVDTSSLIPFPVTDTGNIDYGESGKAIISNGDGTVSWGDVSVEDSSLTCCDVLYEYFGVDKAIYTHVMVSQLDASHICVYFGNPSTNITLYTHNNKYSFYNTRSTPFYYYCEGTMTGIVITDIKLILQNIPKDQAPVVTSDVVVPVGNQYYYTNWPDGITSARFDTVLYVSSDDLYTVNVYNGDSLIYSNKVQYGASVHGPETYGVYKYFSGDNTEYTFPLTITKDMNITVLNLYQTDFQSCTRALYKRFGISWEEYPYLLIHDTSNNDYVTLYFSKNHISGWLSGNGGGISMFATDYAYVSAITSMNLAFDSNITAITSHFITNHTANDLEYNEGPSELYAYYPNGSINMNAVTNHYSDVPVAPGITTYSSNIPYDVSTVSEDGTNEGVT